LFSWGGSSWTQQELFVASDAAGLDIYGQVASLSRDALTLVISAQSWEDAINSQGTVYTYKQLAAAVEQLVDDACSAIASLLAGSSITKGDSAGASESVVPEVIQWFHESVLARDTPTAQANTSSSFADNAVATDALVSLFTQLVADQASGADTWYLNTANLIADLAVATGVVSSQLVAQQALAEVIVALDMLEQGLLETLSDSAAAQSSVAAQVAAVQAVLEAAQAADSATSYLLTFSSVQDTAVGADTLTLWQSLTQCVENGATAFVRLIVDGEVITGWVLNTQAGAVSEYQGLACNSLARIGNRYFGADDSGIHELTGTKDGTTNIVTYLQTGLMDFGTSYTKSVQYGYIGADSEGRVALGVSVSEKSDVRQYWYEITADNVAATNLKLPIGLGLKGR